MSDLASDEALGPWVEAVLRNAPQFLKPKGSSAALRHRAESWVAMQLERITDEAFATKFEKHCPVQGCTPPDYNQRILELASGTRLLTGIRFSGRRVLHPFVDLVASTSSWEDERSAILEAIRAEYRPFAPLSLRIVGPETTCTRPDELIDQTFHAAPLSAVASSGEVPSSLDLRLRVAGPEDVDGAFSQVTEAYAEFRGHDPELAERVQPAKRDDLAECVESGLLTFVHLRGRDAGVLCANTSTSWLFGGLCVVEEVLLREFTGQGLAAHAQRLFARELLARGRTEVLWGTIDDLNHASRKTAERAGRPARAAWRYLDLQDPTAPGR